MLLSKCVVREELDESCSQHDMVYKYFKDLNRGIAADNVLHGKAFDIAKNPKYDGSQCKLALIV